MKTLTKKVLVTLSVAMLAVGMISPATAYAKRICMKEGCNNTAGYNGYCSIHKKLGDPKICLERNCNRKATGVGDYCNKHTCNVKGCYNHKTTSDGYCSQHAGTKSSKSSKKSYSYSSYDDGYEAISEDDDYDEERYKTDSAYAEGVDDAMDECDW